MVSKLCGVDATDDDVIEDRPHLSRPGSGDDHKCFLGHGVCGGTQEAWLVLQGL